MVETCDRNNQESKQTSLLHCPVETSQITSQGDNQLLLYLRQTGKGLERGNLISLFVRCKNACAKLFDQVRSDPNYKLSSMLPEPSLSNYDLRNTRPFKRPKVRTDRFLRTCIPKLVFICQRIFLKF